MFIQELIEGHLVVFTNFNNLNQIVSMAKCIESCSGQKIDGIFNLDEQGRPLVLAKVKGVFKMVVGSVQNHKDLYVLSYLYRDKYKKVAPLPFTLPKVRNVNGVLFLGASFFGYSLKKKEEESYYNIAEPLLLGNLPIVTSMIRAHKEKCLRSEQPKGVLSEKALAFSQRAYKFIEDLHITIDESCINRVNSALLKEHQTKEKLELDGRSFLMFGIEEHEFIMSETDYSAEEQTTYKSVTKYMVELLRTTLASMYRLLYV